MNDTGTAVSTPEPGRDLSHSPARMKRKRFEAGLGLCEAAKLAGRSPAWLSEIEHGKYSPRPPDLAAIAKLYDCEIGDLMPDIAA